jgi:hypothetical protein
MKKGLTNREKYDLKIKNMVIDILRKKNAYVTSVETNVDVSSRSFDGHTYEYSPGPNTTYRVEFIVSTAGEKKAGKK